MKKELIIWIVIALIVGIGIGYLIFNGSTKESIDEPTKLRICPDEWYDNQMPVSGEINTASELPPRQYFIINNERRELEKFDVDWIKENCEVNEPAVVY